MLFRITLLTLSLVSVSLFASAAQAALDREAVVTCPETNSQCWPDAFDFTPNGNVFYAERYTGEIHRYKTATGTNTVWKTLSNVGTDGEQGVLGLALDPRWPDKSWVYVYYTQADPLKNKVVRFKKKANGHFKREVLASFPAAWNHNGGVIRFGSDGKLYVVVGDAGDAANAQDLGDKSGKVYRLNKNGSIPNDNPFDGTAAFFSWGHRNMYGLAFDPFDRTPATPEAWVTENGPECNDELNYVEESNNYGWGESEACPDTNNSGDGAVEPTYTWSETIAVTGAEFCHACNLGGGTNGDLFIGAYNNGNIMQADLNQDRDGVSSLETVYENGSGILGMKADPDGSIVFSDAYGIYRLVKD